MKKKGLLFILALVFLLAACSQGATPTTAPALTNSNFPTGKFIKEGETDYGLMFNADGTFWVFEGENIFVRATYDVDDNILTETSNDGGCETNVSFNYTFDGSTLTLNYVGNSLDDAACTGRYSDFNGVTYTLTE